MKKLIHPLLIIILRVLESRDQFVFTFRGIEVIECQENNIVVGVQHVLRLNGRDDPVYWKILPGGDLMDATTIVIRIRKESRQNFVGVLVCPGDLITFVRVLVRQFSLTCAVPKFPIRVVGKLMNQFLNFIVEHRQECSYFRKALVTVKSEDFLIAKLFGTEREAIFWFWRS